MYEVGESVVYPGHGVCKIKDIVERRVSDVNKKFFMLRTLGADISILVPEDKINYVGLRRVVDVDVANKVFEILGKCNNGNKANCNHGKTNWNRRFREYTERIKTGNVVYIAEVLRSLYNVKKMKELSFGEKRIVNTSKSLLIQELSISKKCPPEEIYAEIESALCNGKLS